VRRRDSFEQEFLLLFAKKKLDRLLRESPSRSLARNHLLRLLESGNSKALGKIPPAELPNLFRLLGGSAFLSDVLIRQGKNWPEIFLRHIKVAQKSAPEHAKELHVATKNATTFDEFCAALRQYE
jgi:hypothetical protein